MKPNQLLRPHASEEWHNFGLETNVCSAENLDKRSSVGFL